MVMRTLGNFAEAPMTKKSLFWSH